MNALGFWARIDGRGAGEVAAALDRMGIGALAEVPVRMLSTGQRRRAAIARVLASDAAIWLLDEPGSGLDEAALGALAETIADHRADGGIAVVATHQPLAIDPYHGHHGAGTMRAIFLLAGRELRLGLAGWALTIVFFLLVATLYSLALGPGAATLAEPNSPLAYCGSPPCSPRCCRSNG